MSNIVYAAIKYFLFIEVRGVCTVSTGFLVWSLLPCKGQYRLAHVRLPADVLMADLLPGQRGKSPWHRIVVVLGELRQQR